MTIFLTIIHVIVCVFLIAVILLQAGRGQGLSTSSFSSGAQSLLGTKTTSFMKKLTSVCAITFLFTSLLLVVMSIKKNQSVFQDLPPEQVENLANKIKQLQQNAETVGENTEIPQSDSETTATSAETVQTTAAES